jgi:hypothetical protein
LKTWLDIKKHYKRDKDYKISFVPSNIVMYNGNKKEVAEEHNKRKETNRPTIKQINEQDAH